MSQETTGNSLESGEDLEALLSEPIFIDTSIALTCNQRIGQAYAPAIMELIGIGKIRAVSDTLVLQEIVDYTGGTNPLLDIFTSLMGRILDVGPENLTAARELSAQYPGRHARVYLHAAVMKRHGIRNIFAVAGSGFEELPVVRSLPLTFADALVAPQ